MVIDALSDLVIRIKNGYRAGQRKVEMPHSRVKEAVAKVLASEGYVEKAEHIDKNLTIKLKYDDKTPAMTDIRRVSRPGRRVYSGIKNLPRVWGALGISVLSTPKGIMSSRQARHLNVGGEVICQVW